LINASTISLMGLKNAYIANNIFTGKLSTAFRFARKSTGNDGEKIVLRFDGIMKNNAFWGTAVPSVSADSKICNPRFVGNDETNPNSYMLAENSSLIGAGVKIDDCGKYDFYGNHLSDTVNIGCYGGNGEESTVKSNFFAEISAYLNTVLGAIYNFIYTCNDLYWIF